MDLKTILICLFVINLFMSLFTFVVKLSHRTFVGINYWIVSNGLIALGYLLIGFRGTIPDLFSIVIAQFVFVFAAYIRIIGIITFLGKRIQNRQKIIAIIILLIYTNLLLYFTYIHKDMYIRTLIVGFLLSGLSFYTGLFLIKNKPKKNDSVFILTTATFFVFAFIFCLRIVVWTFFPAFRDLFKASWVNDIQFFSSLVIDILWTTLFFVLNEQKITNQYIESEAKISAILRTLPDMMFIQNVEGIYLDFFIPKNACTHKPPKIALGQTMQNVLPPPVAAEFLVRFEKALQTKQMQWYEYSMEISGTFHFYEARTICLDTDKLLTIVRDITQNKEAEKIIIHQNQELVELNSTKDKFFSIIAHDLKNPFNAILGYTTLLLKNLHNYDLRKIEKQISIIEHCSLNAYDLVVNLLEWASMHDGKMKFTPQKVELRDLMAKNVLHMQAPASKKDISILIENEFDFSVFCDIKMIDTVLRNLLSNAIKFTPVDGIIKLYSTKKQDKIEISVSDSGMGIHLETQEKLFKITEKVTTKGTDGEHGTGLGLILCKEFVEKNGGKIWVESQIAKGSTFKFTVPIYRENN